MKTQKRKSVCSPDKKLRRQKSARSPVVHDRKKIFSKDNLLSQTLFPSSKKKKKDSHFIRLHAYLAWGCVFTNPDVRYLDIFGAFTCIGSKRFRRLHASRHQDALYVVYSQFVGEIHHTCKCFSFGQVAALHSIKLPSFLFFFVNHGWLCFLVYICRVGVGKEGFDVQREQYGRTSVKFSYRLEIKVMRWQELTWNWSGNCMWNYIQKGWSYAENF